MPRKLGNPERQRALGCGCAGQLLTAPNQRAAGQVPFQFPGGRGRPPSIERIERLYGIELCACHRRHAILHAKNAHKTAEWYARLGFEVEGEHQFAPDMPYYLFLARDGIHLHLSEHRGDARVGTLLYFYVHDVDSIAAEFGASVIDQPWAREVQLTDPDGNRLRIGERRE